MADRRRPGYDGFTGDFRRPVHPRTPHPPPFRYPHYDDYEPPWYRGNTPFDEEGPTTKHPTLLTKSTATNNDREDKKEVDKSSQDSDCGPIESKPPPSEPASIQSKLSLPPVMPNAMKLIDEFYNWQEIPSDFLLDQTDFLVVGVAGLQGSGKSTVLSMIAGNPDSLLAPGGSDDYLFASQNLETRERALHETYGLDMFVTRERVILLDVQPLLSSAVLDSFIKMDSVVPPDFQFAENLNEIHSLQLLAFLVGVCHVVLIVQDWILDYDLLSFILKAEMLKPATPPPPSDSPDPQSEPISSEYFPSVVFVMNKCEPTILYTPTATENLQSFYHYFFQHSRLRTTNGVNIFRSEILPKRSASSKSHRKVNVFLLPDWSASDSLGQGDSDTPGQRGGLYGTCVRALRRQVLAAARPSFLPFHSFSERSWLIYAQKTWETLRKSSMLVEYGKLLK